MGHMNTATPLSTNAQLRALIEAAGLTQAEALERFNDTLFRPYTLSTWKAYFCAPGTVRHRAVPADVLTRAKQVLAPRKRRT